MRALTTKTILCEIHAPRASEAGALAEIAADLARDVGQPLAVKTLALGRQATTREPVLTLHLPVELASSQHQIWCLACQLACFCPFARISVLVQGEAAFARPKPSRERKRSA